MWSWEGVAAVRGCYKRPHTQVLRVLVVWFMRKSERERGWPKLIDHDDDAYNIRSNSMMYVCLYVVLYGAPSVLISWRNFVATPWYSIDVSWENPRSLSLCKDTASLSCGFYIDIAYRAPKETKKNRRNTRIIKGFTGLAGNSACFTISVLFDTFLRVIHGRMPIFEVR